MLTIILLVSLLKFASFQVAGQQETINRPFHAWTQPKCNETKASQLEVANHQNQIQSTDDNFNQHWRQPLKSFGGDAAIASMQTYIDELKQGFKVLIRDKSIDERLANVLYSVEMKTVVNHDFFRFNSGDKRQDLENERLVAGPKVDDELCGQQLREMLSLIRQLDKKLKKRRLNPNWPLHLEDKHIRLARVLESYGRYEPGTLSGRTHSFGSYNQCLQTALQLNSSRVGNDGGDDDDDNPTNNQLVGSRYCWARLSINKYLNPELKFRKKPFFEPNKHMLSTGICVPETCHTSSFKKHRKLFQQLVDSQFKLPQSIYIDEHLELESVFCLVDGNSEAFGRIPTNGKILIGLLIIWLSLACYVTFNRGEIASLTSAKLRQVLECLNLKNSYDEFVGAKGPTTSRLMRVNFDAANPVRFAGSAFVVWAHSLLVRMGYAMDQIQLPSQLEQEWAGGMVIVSSSVVDTFFVLTGLLISYITLKKASKQRTEATKKDSEPPAVDQNNNNVVVDKKRAGNQMSQLFAASYLIVKARYLRLLPMLMLVYWFKRSVFIYLGSGPMWDFGLNRETTNGGCLQESWLVPLTFTSAYLPLSRQCLMQSWSVSNDMLNTLALAPILIIMTRKPRLAISMVVCICLASYTSLLTAIKNLEPGDAWAVSDLRAQGMGAIFARISNIYSYPHFRITAFAVGAIAGYALFWYDKYPEKEWPKWLKGPATIASTLYVLFMFLVLANGAQFKPYITPHHILLFPYFMSFGKTLWAASNSVLFLRMMTDWNQSFLMRMSSGKFWQSMSKLNYAILLLHYDLLLYDINNPTQGNINNLYSIFKAFTTVYSISSVLGVALFICFENPMDKLTKAVFLSRSNERDTNKASDIGDNQHVDIRHSKENKSD